jgi:hypothetical protein
VGGYITRFTFDDSALRFRIRLRRRRQMKFGQKLTQQDFKHSSVKTSFSGGDGDFGELSAEKDSI